MKSLLCSLALVACVVACKSNSTNSVGDPATPNASAPACSEKSGACGTTCTEGQKASCCQKDKPQG